MRKKSNLVLSILILQSLALSGCTYDEYYRTGQGLWATSESLYDSINGGTSLEDIQNGNVTIESPTPDEVENAVDEGLTTYYGDDNATVKNFANAASEKADEYLSAAGDTLSSKYNELSEEAKKAYSEASGEAQDILSNAISQGREASSSVNLSNSGMSYSKTELPSDSFAEVHYIDVGQGDCTLIECDGHYMLIDAGEDDKGTYVQNYLRKQGISFLDYLIITHNDSDHCGGADVIITKFDIGKIFMTEKNNKTAAFRNVVNALSYRNYAAYTPQVGLVYSLGNATFTIVAPNRTYDTTNNSSIAFLFQHGSNRFLFTGDCEEDAEKDICSNGIDVSADVYKAGHHGSKTASSQLLLNAVRPTYCVISCGMGNSYYHPHASTLNKLRKQGIKVFRTDEQGCIIAYSDGNIITFNCSPSDSWKAGEGESDLLKNKGRKYGEK